MLGSSNLNSPMLGSGHSNQPLMLGSGHSNQPLMLGSSNLNSPMLGSGHSNQPLMMGSGHLTQPLMMGSGSGNAPSALGEVDKREAEQITNIGREGEKITNLLNNFIKTNNLSQEDQQKFYDELKKINSNLPSDKKIILSLEKNNLKFQVVNAGSDNTQLDSRQESNTESSPEIKTHDFNRNMWYISLFSTILTFLVIILLVIKWKDL
jgi:hypothetical protein